MLRIYGRFETSRIQYMVSIIPYPAQGDADKAVSSSVCDYMDFDSYMGIPFLGHKLCLLYDAQVTRIRIIQPPHTHKLNCY